MDNRKKEKVVAPTKSIFFFHNRTSETWMSILNFSGSGSTDYSSTNNHHIICMCIFFPLTEKYASFKQ